MQKLKQYWVIISLAILGLGTSFYWYEWRPKQIRANCFEETKAHYADKDGFDRLEFDFIYKYCLQKNGLEK